MPNRAVDDRDCGAHEQALWLIALDRGDHFLIGHVTAAGHQQNRDAMTTASANRPTKVPIMLSLSVQLDDAYQVVSSAKAARRCFRHFSQPGRPIEVNDVRSITAAAPVEPLIPLVFASPSRLPFGSRGAPDRTDVHAPNLGCPAVCDAACRFNAAGAPALTTEQTDQIAVGLTRELPTASHPL